MQFVNDGAINVTAGTLTLGNGTGDSVTNGSTGVITVSAGATLDLHGGVASISNTGTLQATGGGIINLEGNFATNGLGGTINDVGSTLWATWTIPHRR